MKCCHNWVSCEEDRLITRDHLCRYCVVPHWGSGPLLNDSDYSQCMGENRRKTLSTTHGRGGVSTWYFHQIQVGMWAKLWDMSHLFVCFVTLVIHGGAMAKFWPLHHYNQCMGENRRKTLSTAHGRGGMSSWCFHQIQVGMWAKLWDMSHFFVCFVTLVIQGGAMAKFWPLHHYNQCMGENRRKTRSTARGRGGVLS